MYTSANVTSCADTQKAILVYIGAEEGEAPTDAQVETAAGHITRCATCRGVLTPEQRGRFIHEFVMDRG